MLINAILGHLQRDFEGGTIIVPLKIKSTTAADELLKLKGKVLDVDIKQHRRKRSLRANNYAWTLMTQIADKLNVSKEDVYEKMLRRYGQSTILSGVSQAHQELVNKFSHVDIIGESELNGKQFKHYKIHFGESTYDTKEMSIFLNGVVEEAKELEIPTLDDMRVQELIDKWDNQ